ncbi:MAG: glucosyl-3-phosphoglycerate synthase [Candidatus Dormibacterales bacterium]
MSEGRLDIVVPVIRAAAAPRLLDLAESLLRHHGGTGRLLGVVEVPYGRPIARSVTVARRYRTLLQRITSLPGLQEAGVGVQVRVTHDVAVGIREAVYESGANLLILEWPGLASHRGHRFGAVVDDLVSDPPTDLLLVRHGGDRGGEPETLRSILVPIRGGASARLALTAARALASFHGASLTAMHAYRAGQPEDRRRRESRQFHQLVESAAEPRPTVLEVDAPHPGRAILEEAARHQAVVLGAYSEAVRSPTVVGSALERTVRRLPGTVVIAKSASAGRPPVDPELPYPFGRDTRPSVSTLVDRWFAENTFHSREFKDLARLVQLKKSQGLTISLALPTRNEEATIGKIIRVITEDLVERYPLLDEVVVIDSASTDRTVEIARGMGVSVLDHRRILPSMGSYQGKGEALWKSLYALKGDVIAWCDTDISNIHPQFVFGVLGPLLADPRIGYVKGFYRRPLNFGSDLLTAGGGRVTELTARPIINLFYPELSGILQPLSGEYAGRRELLEKVPFFTGYGVEMGLLIDILETFGLNRIAQSDLGMRIHRNQELFELSKMAFAIMQVALKRLGDRHRIHLLEEVNRNMKLIHYSGDRFFLEVKDIEDQERQPIVILPDYGARRQAVGAGDTAAESALGV